MSYELNNLSELRKRAEAQLPPQTLCNHDLSPIELARLVHELQTHQIELELQNEELRHA